METLPRMTRGRKALLQASLVVSSAILVCSAGLVALVPGAAGRPGRVCNERVSEPPPLGSIVGARRKLIPAGRIRNLLVCRYPAEPVEYGRTSGQLAAERTVGHRSAEAVAERLEALPPVRGSTFNCPADFGGRLFLLFRLDSRRSVVLTAHSSGCRFVTSPGAREVVQLPFGLQRTLERLAP
jgi:hypothetical protein